VALATAASPGAACWNVFTNNGKFLYVTKPAAFGANVDAFRVEHDGTLTLINSQPTNHNSIDDALSHDSRFLYVLSDALLPVMAPASAINEYSIDPQTGAITQIGSLELPGNSTAGLAAW
jgi:6-phosphogluconolactonase (cycloisomerase 2 family)